MLGLVPVESVMVEVTLVPMPAVIFVRAGAAVIEENTLVAAVARQGMARTAARTAAVWMFLIKVFIGELGVVGTWLGGQADAPPFPPRNRVGNPLSARAGGFCS